MVFTLRSTVNVVSALAAVGLVTFISYYTAGQIRERRAVEAVAQDVVKFRQVLAYRAASNQTEVNTRGWPVTVDPEWFAGDPPRNSLVTSDRPWVEIATATEASLLDPVQRMTIAPQLASFWYNPYQGIVRARVPVSINDRKALELYNSINATHLTEIYGVPPETTGTAGATGPTGATGDKAVEDAATEAARTALVGEDNSLDPTVPRPSAVPPASPKR